MDMPGLAAMPDAVMEGDHCAIYPFRNESGEGTITIYQVFPGVCLSCFADSSLVAYPLKSSFNKRAPS